MKRPLKPEDQRLWSLVAATVHPLPGRKVAKKPMPQTLDAPARIEPKRAEEARNRARAALDAFLQRAFADGWRAVLVITGKGVQGDGVLKKRVPDWLGAPHLAHIVAGISDAHRRHGGEGALYVALKRKPRG